MAKFDHLLPSERRLLMKEKTLRTNKDLWFNLSFFPLMGSILLVLMSMREPIGIGAAPHVVNVFVTAFFIACYWGCKVQLKHIETLKFLSRQHAKCPECQYDFENITDLGCPECGWRRA